MDGLSCFVIPGSTPTLLVAISKLEIRCLGTLAALHFVIAQSKIQHRFRMNVQFGKRLGRAALRKHGLLPNLQKGRTAFLSLWHPPAFENEATV